MAKAPLAQRVKSDPALLKRVLANPGLRSKLPDSYLSPDQLSVRNRHRFIDNIGDLGTPMSGSSLVNAGQQLTDLKYAPQFATLDRNAQQATANRDQQQRFAGDYSSQLNDILGGLVGSQGAANQQSQAAMNAQRQATMQAIDAAAGGEQQRVQQDSAVRGDLANIGADQRAQQDAQARARAATNSQAAADEGTAANGAQAALLRGIQAATGQRGQENQQQIGAAAQKQLGDIANQRQGLAASEGQDLVSTILGLRSSEGDRLVTQQGLANDAEKATLDAKTAAAKIKSQADLEAARQQFQAQLTQAGYDHDTAKQMADQQFQAQQKELDRQNAVTVAKSRGAGGSKLGAPATQAKAQSGIESALSIAKTLSNMPRSQAAQYLVQGTQGGTVYDPKTGKPVIDPKTRTKESTRTIKAQDPLWASVALDLVFDGHVSANNVKRLHARGVAVNSLGYPTHLGKPVTKPTTRKLYDTLPGR